VAVGLTLRHVPESRDPEASHRPALLGALAATVGLAGVVFGLIEWPAECASARVVVSAVVGVAALVAFPFVEQRTAQPLVPLGIFRDPQFFGANATTLTVYAAFGGALFLLVLVLQQAMGYSALAAGAALLPITVLMLALSARTAALSQRIGPRLPMTGGPVVVAIGLFLAAGLGPGDTYAAGVLPAVVVIGLGLSLTVAPLTAAVMAAVDERHVGVASGVNNAVARIGTLLSVALLPLVAGLGDVAPGDPRYTEGVGRALRVAAGLCLVGGAVAFATVRRGARVTPVVQPSVSHGCADPSVREPLAS